MLNSLLNFLTLRKRFVALVLVMFILAPALTIKTSADDPPYYGQIIRTNYYQDGTYTGIYTSCDYNTCTGQEVCTGQKTIYAVEVNRFSISCDGFWPPSN